MIIGSIGGFIEKACIYYSITFIIYKLINLMVNDSVDKQPIYDNAKATESSDSVDYQLQELITGTQDLITYPKKEIDPEPTKEFASPEVERFHDANEKPTVLQTVKDGLGNEYRLDNGILFPMGTLILPQQKIPLKPLPKFNRIPPKITRNSSKVDLFQQQQKLIHSLQGFGTTSNSRFGELDKFQTKLKSASTSKTGSRSANSKSSRGSKLITTTETTPEPDLNREVQEESNLQQEPILEQP